MSPGGDPVPADDPTDGTLAQPPLRAAAVFAQEGC